jgi:hypothetical protein
LPEPPPTSHATLIKQARAWVAAMGGNFVDDSKCGCKIENGREITVNSEMANHTFFYTLAGERVDTMLHIRQTMVSSQQQ